MESSEPDCSKPTGQHNDGFQSTTASAVSIRANAAEGVAEHGEQLTDRMPSQSVIMAKLRINNATIREFMAECIGIFVLMVFGNGAVAQAVLSKGGDGDYLTIYWGYGMGVTLGVYIAGGVSGAHLNPAVSVSMCALGKLPWTKLPVYVTAQLLGAFLSGPVVFGIYYDALNAYDGGQRQVLGVNGTASIFATYPKDYLSISNGFFDQVFATALLLGGVLAITDERNNKPPSGMEPLLVGLLVFALGNSYGTNCGYAINPARDLGPRIFTCIAGWGPEVFTAPDNQIWSWVPVVAPVIGGLLGSFVYVAMIQLHWPPIADPGTPRRGSCKEMSGLRHDEGRLIEQMNPDQESGTSAL